MTNKTAALGSDLLKSKFIEIFGLQTVDRAAIIAQLVLLAASAAGFYESRTHRSVRAFLAFISRLERYAWFGRSGFGIGSGYPHHSVASVENFPPRMLGAASVAILMLVIASGTGPFRWLLYPLVQLWAAVAVWFQLVASWQALLIPVKSLLLVLWSLLSALLIYGLGGGILLRSVALTAGWTQQKLSERAFHLMLFLVTLLAGLALVAVSADW